MPGRPHFKFIILHLNFGLDAEGSLEERWARERCARCPDAHAPPGLVPCFFTPDPWEMGRAAPLSEGRFLAPLFLTPTVLVGARASPVGPSTRLCATGTALQRSLFARRDSGCCCCCHYAAPCDAGRVSELVMSSQGGLQGYRRVWQRIGAGSAGMPAW